MTPPICSPNTDDPPSNRLDLLVRTAAALLLVWSVSVGASLMHLSAVAAAVWIVAALALCPIGTTVTDRIVALSLLGSALAVLIAWFSPLAPWMVGPIALTGLLGTTPALAWGLRLARGPRWRGADTTSIAMGALTAALYWFPFALGGLDRAIGVLSAGFDQIAHFFLWFQVWANHGYLLINTLPEPDAWGWRVYPQGAHAVLADIGTVLTSSPTPPAEPTASVTLFAALVCLLAGMLALIAAWGVDRLGRTSEGSHPRRLLAMQIIAAALVALGPGSVIAVQSVSFTAGVAAILAALAVATTCAKSPRLGGILLGAAVIAASALYPICALTAIGLWPLYLWTCRQYWLGTRRRQVGAIGLTAAVAALSAPMFVLLVSRKIDHNWDVAGYFQALHPVSFVAITAVLALLLVLAAGRLPSPVVHVMWLAAAITGALVAEGLWQWLTAGAPTYYTIKTLYLAWMMSVVAVAGALTCLHRRDQGAHTVAGIPRRQLAASVMAAAALLVGSLLLSLPTSRVQSDDPSQGWTQAVSKRAWVIYHQNAFTAQYGSPSVSTTRFAAEHDGVTVFAPCFGDVSPTALRWAMALTGGMSQTDMDVLAATCPGNTEQVLGNLPQYLLAHPEVTVNALTLDEDAYLRALAIRDRYRLSNLRVVPEHDLEPQ